VGLYACACVRMCAWGWDVFGGVVAVCLCVSLFAFLQRNLSVCVSVCVCVCEYVCVLVSMCLCACVSVNECVCDEYLNSRRVLREKGQFECRFDAGAWACCTFSYSWS